MVDHTCGSCFFFRPDDEGGGTCYGLPPVPSLRVRTEEPQGGFWPPLPRPVTVSQRPRVEASDPCCSLWRRASDREPIRPEPREDGARGGGAGGEA